MITRTLTKFIPFALRAARPYLSSAPRFCFSKVEKFKEFRAVLEHEISEESKSLSDLKLYEQEFKSAGWAIKQEHTLVELSKQADGCEIKLLSNIKAPSSFQGNEEEGAASKDPNGNEEEMNEITICLTKEGEPKTMVVHAVIGLELQIIGINFANSYKQAKEQRLDFFNHNQYPGPAVETIPNKLFQALNSYLEQLGLTYNFLKTLADYCLDSQQNFYINWLKDLKNTL